jgi:hypothetical protein
MTISAAARAKRSAAAEAGALLLHDSTSLDFRFPRPRPGNPKHLEPNPLHFMEYAPMPSAHLACQDDGFLRPSDGAMAYQRSRSPVLHGRLRLSGPPVRPWSDRGYNRPRPFILGTTLVLLRCPRTREDEVSGTILPPFSALVHSDLLKAIGDDRKRCRGRGARSPAPRTAPYARRGDVLLAQRSIMKLRVCRRSALSEVKPDPRGAAAGHRHAARAPDC